MPSPFPGMDPYLEAPDIWPDFHDAFAGEISGELNQALPSPYYARLVTRPEVGIVEEGRIRRRIVPDVPIVRHHPPKAGGGEVAVLEMPRRTISKWVELSIHIEPIRHAFVEIRDPTRGHQLVTLMEIVSPSNKRPGPDRQAYFQKQREVLECDANLIEVDLLRSGERLLANVELEHLLEQLEPVPDYMVLVNRAWTRTSAGLSFQVFPVLLTELLPCIPVPLRQGQEEVLLDLQFVMNCAYDSGPYRRGAVDYGQPPVPPLPSELIDWAEQCLRDLGTAGPPAS